MKSFDEIMMSKEFMDFMNKKDNDAAKYWEQLINNNPFVKEDFDKAQFIHKTLIKNKKHKISDKDKIIASNKLLYRIDAFEKSKNGTLKIHAKKWIYAAAAILIFIFLSIPGLKYFQESEKFNEISVPSGEKSTIKLSDGTTIWLNSESKLKYPSKFKKKSREVFLEGEGYFDVVKQNGAKFTVITQDIKVIALGTIFDIKSYPAEKIIETTLVEGEVKIEQVSNNKKFQDITLKPNQKIVYRKAEHIAKVENIKNQKSENLEEQPDNDNKTEIGPLISIKQVNPENIVSWKDHLLVFDNETFEEIAVKMSRWYKIKVNISDEDLKNHRFTGKFVNNETYLQVLEAINLTTPISFNITENVVTIKRKNKNP